MTRSQGAPDRRKTALNVLGFLVRLAITLGLFAFVFSKIDLESTIENVRRLGYFAFAGSTVLLFFNTSLVAPRWQAILKWYRVKLSGLLLLQLAMIGYFFNQVLPSNIGGDAIRVWGLRRQGVSLKKSTRSVIVDRLFGLAIFFVFALVGLPFLLRENSSLRLPVFALLGLAAISGVLFLLALYLNGTQTFLRRLQFLFDFAHDVKLMLLNPSVAIPCLFYSGVGNLFPIFVVAWIGAPLTDLTLADYFAITPVALLISVLPLSIAGWGVREAAMVVCMAEKGVPPETAIVISVTFGLIMTVSALPGGIVWFLTWRRTAKGADGLA